VSFSCICLVVDHVFHYNTVKVADWIHEARADGCIDYFNNVMTKFIDNNRIDALKAHVKLFFHDNKLSDCPLSPVDTAHKLWINVSVCLLTIKISQGVYDNFCNYRKKRVLLYCCQIPITNVKRHLGIRLTDGVKGWFSIAGLSLSAGCQQNLLAEKEVWSCTSWTLPGDHSVTTTNSLSVTHIHIQSSNIWNISNPNWKV